METTKEGGDMGLYFGEGSSSWSFDASASNSNNNNNKAQSVSRIPQEELERIIKTISANLSSSAAAYVKPKKVKMPYNYSNEFLPQGTFDFGLVWSKGLEAHWQPVNGTFNR